MYNNLLEHYEAMTIELVEMKSQRDADMDNVLTKVYDAYRDE